MGFLAACTSATPTAVPVDTRRASRFQELMPGISTMKDAVNIMGVPNSMTQMPNGQGVVTWWEWNGPTHLLSVSLMFTADGKYMRLLTITRT